MPNDEEAKTVPGVDMKPDWEPSRDDIEKNVRDFESQVKEAQQVGYPRSLGGGQGGSTGAAPEPLMQFFTYKHLPQHLQDASMLFCELAEVIVLTIPRNPERTTALRKLLESKDCAVRAVLFK